MRQLTKKEIQYIKAEVKRGSHGVKSRLALELEVNITTIYYWTTSTYKARARKEHDNYRMKNRKKVLKKMKQYYYKNKKK